MKKVWLGIALVVAAIVLVLFFRKHEPPRLAFTPVRRQTIVSNLPTNGKVEPLEWQAVHAEVPGLISSVPVKLGQSVTKGFVIARIAQPGVGEEVASSQARAGQVRSELETLRRGGKSAELAELDASAAKAQFDRDVAQRDYTSLKRLLDKQAATNVEVIMARQRLDAAELLIKSIAQRRAALVSPNDLASGRAKLAEAEALAQSARARFVVGVVLAPLGGIVYSLPARPGAYVEAGAPIASIGELDRVRVKVFVDEPDLGRIRVGLPVRITWEGLPGRSWDGSVERLPTEIVALGSRQVGEVWVTIGNSNHELVPGTTVNAEVRTDVAQNALVVPKSVLRRDRGPVGVFVLRQGRLDWQPIVTGNSNVSDVAIRQGLKEGELVLLPTDTPFKEDDRVRAIVQ